MSILYATTILDLLVSEQENQRTGSRNHDLWRRTSTALEQGFNPDEVRERMTAAGLKCGLGKAEVRDVIKSAFKDKKARVPAGVPPVPAERWQEVWDSGWARVIGLRVVQEEDGTLSKRPNQPWAYSWEEENHATLKSDYYAYILPPGTLLVDVDDKELANPDQYDWPEDTLRRLSTSGSPNKEHIGPFRLYPDRPYPKRSIQAQPGIDIIVDHVVGLHPSSSIEEMGAPETWPMVPDIFQPKAVKAKGMDAADLLDIEHAPLQWKYEGLLVEGLSVVGAPPKVGKSLLMYQASVNLALGVDLLGCTVTPAPVLYYALEDGERRSKRRIKDILAGRSLPRGKFELRWDSPKLGGPLEEEVGEWLAECPGGVVIIDVLSKVRPADMGRSLNAYDADYQLLSTLHNVSKANIGSAIVVVTHDRKAGSEDWMSRITGTRGITGVADTSIYIDRKRTETVGVVYVTGRDIEDGAINVQFTGDGWQPADPALVIGTKSPIRQTIFGWLQENGPAWQKGIADGTGLDINTVHQRVKSMADDGDIVPAPNRAGYEVPMMGVGA